METFIVRYDISNYDEFEYEHFEYLEDALAFMAKHVKNDPELYQSRETKITVEVSLA